MAKIAKMKVYMDEGGFPPVRGHEGDGGLDLRTPQDVMLKAGGTVVIDTKTHVQIPFGYVGLLTSKSGLYVKNNITGRGTIDYGYTGPIIAKLCNDGTEDKMLSDGDKVIQLVIVPCWLPELYFVESIEEFGETERGFGGFGSTGA